MKMFVKAIYAFIVLGLFFSCSSREVSSEDLTVNLSLESRSESVYYDTPTFIEGESFDVNITVRNSTDKQLLFMLASFSHPEFEVSIYRLNADGNEFVASNMYGLMYPATIGQTSYEPYEAKTFSYTVSSSFNFVDEFSVAFIDHDGIDVNRLAPGQYLLLVDFKGFNSEISVPDRSFRFDIIGASQGAASTSDQIDIAPLSIDE